MKIKGLVLVLLISFGIVAVGCGDGQNNGNKYNGGAPISDFGG